MENKKSLIRSLFDHKPAKQTNTPPPAPQTPPEAAPPLPKNIPAEEPSAPDESISRIVRMELAAPPAKLSSLPIREEGVPAAWKVGDLILGEYEVTDILGEGGMGTVYKVHFRRLNIDLAVKSPRPEIFTRTDGKENFIREVEVWMHLREHPYLVNCYLVRTLGGIPRIFAQYVDGGSLADWIHQRKLYEGGPARALERMLDVAIQFAWGLHAAHEQGLVHRDVKPANVMLTSQGIAKVTDFGLAKARTMAGEQGIQNEMAEQSPQVSSRRMTRAYCSPEQAARQPLNHKTDIWSWGLSVLEMFVGEVTWTIGIVAPEALANHDPQNPAIPAMPADVVKLLARCFQQQPEKRPATMLEVATELQAIYVHQVGCPYAREAPEPAAMQASTFDKQGMLLQDRGMLEEALVAYEQAIRLDPTYAGAHYNKGNVLKQLGRLEEALLADEEAIRLEPRNADAYNNKGNVLKRLDRLEEALVAYEHAISLAPTMPYVHHNKGLVLAQLGRRKEALAAYERATHLDPGDAKAHYYKGGMLHSLGRVKEALAAYEQVIRLDPKYAPAHFARGVMLEQLRRPGDALLAYEQSIRIDPTSMESHSNKGMVLQQLGRPQEALAAYEQAIRLDPQLGLLYANKGSVLAQLGRFEEALTALDQSIRLDPSHAPAYVNKVLLLTQLGRSQEALSALDQAMRLDPQLAITIANALKA